MIKLASKEYEEVFAKLLLCEVYSKELSSAKVLGVEQPDIQSFESDFGIEVTNGANQNVLRMRSIVKNTFGKNMSKEEIEEYVRVQHLTFIGHIGVVEEENGFNENECTPYISVPLYDRKESYSLISEQIKRKNQLLKKYKKFKKMGLFIYTQTSLITFDELNNFFKSSDIQENLFDVIFIYCFDELFIYEHQKLSVIELDDRLLKQVNEETLEYEEKLF